MREIDEIYLLNRVRQGDQEALNNLLVAYRGFIRFICKRYFLRDGDQQDLMQEATIGFLEAIKSFKESSGIKFRNFAFICIKRELDSVINRSNRKKRQILNKAIPIYSYIENENKRLGSEFYSGENILKCDEKGPEDRVLEKEEMEELLAFLHKELSSLEIQVLQLRLDGCSYREITKMLGIEAKSIDNAMQRIRRKIHMIYSKKRSA